MKPTPISNEQLDSLIKNANQDVTNRFAFVKDIVVDDIEMEDDSGSSIRFSQLSIDKKNDLLDALSSEGFVDGFEIHQVTESCILFRKMNLVWVNGVFFELLESVKSGEMFKIRDRDGKIFDYELKIKGDKKIKTQKNKIKYFKPPKTEGGIDALNNLYK